MAQQATIVAIGAAIAVAATIGILALSSTAPAITNGNVPPGTEKERIVLSGSYPDYQNVTWLVGNSSSIVTGETLGVKSEVDDALVPITDYDFQVNSVIKGNLKSGDVITIRQTGIETKTKIAELADDPLLKKGEQVVGFLRYSEDHDVYIFLGGPQGRFVIQNGAVNSLDKIVPEAEWLTIRADNQDLNQFVESIKTQAGLK